MPAWVWVAPVAAVVFTHATVRKVDSFDDGWWHLRNGQTIVEERRIPTVDEYSYTKKGQPRVPHEWLSEASLYLSMKLAGFPGIMVWRGIIAALTTALAAWFLLLRGMRSAALAVFFLLLGAAISVPEWLERPKIAAPMFFVAALVLLELCERGRRWAFYALPVLMLIWANSHASFIAGAGLIGLRLVCAWTEERAGSASEPFCARLMPWAALALLAPAVSPGGLETIQNPLTYLSGSTSWGLEEFQEWASPNFHKPHGIMFEAGLMAVLISLALSPRRPRLYDLLVVLVTTHLPLQSVRHYAIFGAGAMPIAAGYGDAAAGRLAEWSGVANLRASLDALRAWAARMGRRTWMGVSLALTAALVVVAIPKDGSFDRCVITEELPVEALKVALATPHSGNLFNQYEWGGYIIWAARDRLPVFIDGRADMYGERHYREYQAAIDGSPLWRQVFAKHDIGVVIITQGSPLTLQLENEPAYRRVYGDEISMVYVRDEPAKRLSRAGSGRGVRHAAGERLGGQGC